MTGSNKKPRIGSGVKSNRFAEMALQVNQMNKAFKEGKMPAGIGFEYKYMASSYLKILIIPWIWRYIYILRIVLEDQENLVFGLILFICSRIFYIHQKCCLVWLGKVIV